MTRDARSPVLVGIGVSTQREEDARALEPLDLMIDAVRRAGKDSGAEALLAGVQRVAVPKGRWRYQNPGGETGVPSARNGACRCSRPSESCSKR